MKYKGYSGKVLYVDLSKRNIEDSELDENIAENYTGVTNNFALNQCSLDR
jgi:aldehyde:ferredoxin oxidoreductase